LKTLGSDDKNIELELVKDHIETSPIAPGGPVGPVLPIEAPLANKFIFLCVCIFFSFVKALENI
jgi:hypothetical protein